MTRFGAETIQMCCQAPLSKSRVRRPTAAFSVHVKVLLGVSRHTSTQSERIAGRISSPGIRRVTSVCFRWQNRRHYPPTPCALCGPSRTSLWAPARPLESPGQFALRPSLDYLRSGRLPRAALLRAPSAPALWVPALVPALLARIPALPTGPWQQQASALERANVPRA
jgi:hypothetical protein